MKGDLIVGERWRILIWRRGRETIEGRGVEAHVSEGVGDIEDRGRGEGCAFAAKSYQGG